MILFWIAVLLCQLGYEQWQFYKADKKFREMVGDEKYFAYHAKLKEWGIRRK